jgi:uncharacterized protein (TIGR02147 family)
MEKPLLSTYTDYRAYLRDFYEFRVHESKAHFRPYSYSDFSAAADIKSPNYLKLIIQGERNLSPEMCKKFGRALKFDKAQQTEFEALVFYGQDKDPLERNKYLKQLSEIRSNQALIDGDIDQATWDKVPGWLSWVLYAMIDQENIVFTPEVLRKKLRHQVSEKQIAEALDKLKDDITIDENFKATKKNSMISNADKIPAALIRKLQSELIYLGLESLYRDNPADREISGFTMAMTADEFQWVRHELRKVRKEIQRKLMMNREANAGEKVYQVNIQLFPLTDEAEKRRPESASIGDKDI